MAALVGAIIGQFAITERYPIAILAKLTGISTSDAEAIMGTFRAFSNRLDLIAELLKRRPEGSTERIVFSYFKGLLKEANAIRNKYAHAMYMGGKRGGMLMQPYSGDYNRTAVFEPIDEKLVQTDVDRLAKINGQFDDLLHFDTLPPGLWKQLPLKSRA